MATAVPNIAILILAAGASTRMNTPKQLLPLGTTTFITRAIDVAKATSAKSVYVVLGAHGDLIKKTIDPTIPIILNTNWELGLGSSIAKGVQVLQQSTIEWDGILVMLVDQPSINTPYLNTLIGHFNTGNSGIVATGYPHGPGVPALFSSLYFNELITLDRDFGAKYMLKKYATDTQTIDANGKTEDIDTPEAYRKYIKSKHF